MKNFYFKLSIFLEFLVNGLFVLIYLLLNKDIEKFSNLSWIKGLNSSVLSEAADVLVWVVPFIVLFSLFANFIYQDSIEKVFRKNIFTIILIVPLFICLGDKEFTFWLASVHLFSTLLSFYELPILGPKSIRKEKLKPDFWSGFKLKPAQLVLFSFAALIFLGAGILMLPISVKQSLDLKFLDALFMATSATCVTGLATFQIGSEMTVFGQIVMLILIQIGGLGIMTLSTSMTILLGRSLGVKEQVLMQGLLDVSSLEGLISMIGEIIKLTFIIELWGAILLTIGFLGADQDLSEALYNGIFHSISAFCNAGFSLFPNSLESYNDNVFINLVTISLIVSGGLGFIVLKDVRENLFSRKFSKKRGFIHLTLHSKIVIMTNFSLIVLGTFSFFFSEFLNSLDQYPLETKFLISFFQSITTRTAGFNSIGFDSLHPHTIYFMCLLMFIGASPGSTGGGIKTTTFAILVQSIKTTLRGRKQIEFFDRRISNILSVRATAITIISLMIVSLFLLIMIKVEPNLPFLSIFFETISAFGTTGLSLGITPDLSSIGKVFIIILMYIGRVGPLTLVLAVSQAKAISRRVKYADGRVMIG